MKEIERKVGKGVDEIVLFVEMQSKADVQGNKTGLRTDRCVPLYYYIQPGWRAIREIL